MKNDSLLTMCESACVCAFVSVDSRESCVSHLIPASINLYYVSPPPKPKPVFISIFEHTNNPMND